MKNVLIISAPFDSSTNDVMDWLAYLGCNVTRLNSVDFINKGDKLTQQISNELINVTLETTSLKIDFNKIYSTWFRKDSRFDIFPYTKDISDTDLKTEAEKHLTNEALKSKNSFFSLIKSKKNLGGALTSAPSKMEMLISAKEVYLDIPDTLITNKRESLIPFFNKHEGKIITKPIGEIRGFSKKRDDNTEVSGALYTELIDQLSIDKIPPNFFPSLFQEALDKEFEIRTFFLDGECYSMAIFSQMDDQTSIDFRMYNLEKNNRNIPYKLDDEIEIKIRNLMNNLNLKTGSIDLIKTKKGRTVFLEINPWGQYGHTARACNYNLDKKIAEYLVK